jgi:hypothetical protein
MIHPLIINSKGKLEDNGANDLRASLRDMLKIMSGWDLRPSRIYMNKADYDDIVAWGKEEK